MQADIQPTLSAFPVWKEIQIGGVSCADFITRLQDGKCKLSPDVLTMLRKDLIPFEPTPRRIRLARVTPRMLGSTIPANSQRDVHRRGIDAGFLLCPPETAFHIFDQWDEEGPLASTAVAMEPILIRGVLSKLLRRTLSYDSLSTLKVYKSGGTFEINNREYHIQLWDHAEFLFMFPD